MSKTGGLGSGLDVNAIVTAMMDVEKIPLERMNKSKAIYEQQLSNYTQVRTLVNKFTKAVDNLGPVFNANSLQASSSNESALSAVVSGNAESPGIHNIVITQLASANQIASAAFATKNTAIGLDGSLNVTTGTNSFTLTIDPTDTMENIRDNINYSLSNSCITASILSTTAEDGITPEFRLILTSQQTGSAQAMSLSGTGELALNLTNVLTPANDARLTFDGFEVVRSMNTISDLMDGVTLTLNAPNSSATLTLAADTTNRAENVKKGLTSVVDAYNALIDLIDKSQSTKLTRDSTYSLIKLSLQNTMSLSFNGSTIQSWLDIGVKSAPSVTLVNEDGVEYVSTGKLTFDDDLFTTAIQNNYHAISDFFTAPGGFMATVKTAVTDVTKEGGTISNREKIIKQQESRIDNRMDREEVRLDTVKEKLIKQYAALDTFIQHYQQISGFLEQQIESMSYFRSR